jgi:putative ABC transport system permease protein
MLIAGIGISNTLISFINQKNISIAIMKSLGFTSGTIKKIFYFEIFTVLFSISILSYLLAVLSVPIVNVFLSKALGIAVHSEFVLKNFLKVFLSGFLVVVIFCLPTISAIQQIKPSSLFRNVFQACDFYFNKKKYLFNYFINNRAYSFICIRQSKTSLYYRILFYIFSYLLYALFFI